MKYAFLSLILVVLVSCSTDTVPVGPCYTKDNPPRNFGKVNIEQGIWGDIWFWKGNFMPVERGEICRVKRTVFIYELTTMEDVDQIGYTPFYSAIHSELLATVESDKDGFFQIELEPGTYSIFVGEGENYYSNRYSSNGEIFPVTVEPEEVTELRFDITSEAVF